MSSELVWNIVKNNSSFLRKQKQGCKITTFSTDKMNVTKSTRRRISLPSHGQS